VIDNGFVLVQGASAITDRVSLTWVRGDQRPLSDQHDINENTLVLKNVTKDDQGVYICLGLGPDGAVVFNRPITLKVIGKNSSYLPGRSTG